MSAAPGMPRARRSPDQKNPADITAEKDNTGRVSLGFPPRININSSGPLARPGFRVRLLQNLPRRSHLPHDRIPI